MLTGWAAYRSYSESHSAWGEVGCTKARQDASQSPSAFVKFEKLTRKLLRVSKADVDQKRREYDEAKAKKRDEK